ncbi:hypothetical protein ACOME3_007802 [Neoechinorhynchus agilis]
MQQTSSQLADTSAAMDSTSGNQPLPPSSSNSNIPYLGSKISLISKAKIRYEGILYTIDPQESTVALAKVRSYGTENRLAEHFVPPRSEVYEYIIFRATDIEDLQVSEPPRPTCLHETIRARQQLTRQQQQEDLDPAIVQHAPVAPPAVAAARIQNYSMGNARRRPSFEDLDFEPGFRPPGVPPLSYINRPFRRRGSNMMMSPFGGRGRFRGGSRRSISSTMNTGLKFDGDFDFEKANEEYNRLAEAMQTKMNVSTVDEAINEEPGDHQSDSPPGNKDSRHYDKAKSFFDTISCEALEREKGNDSKIRKSWQEEKQQNAETFGAVYGGNRFGYGPQGPMMNQQRFGRRGSRTFNVGPPRYRRFNDQAMYGGPVDSRFRYHHQQTGHEMMPHSGGNWNNPGGYYMGGGGQGQFRRYNSGNDHRPVYRRNSPAVYG